MPPASIDKNVLFGSVAIVGKSSATGIASSVRLIVNFLEASGRTVILEAETARHLGDHGCVTMTPEEIGKGADLVIVVGGDGTMLRIARQLAPFPVPLIGINQGRLGFMTDIPLHRMMHTLQNILKGEFEAEQRSLLDGVVIRGRKTVFHSTALNDIVVARGAQAGLIELQVTVDQKFMYIQRSDGLIVSSSTGSTAYGLSSGGPVLHPRLGGIALTPIAPHALSNRPIVVPDSSEIEVEVISGRSAYANFDMRSFANLHHHDQIHIRRSQHTVTFLHPRGWNYYETLREKLHWNEYPTLQGTL
jgi:NAD+ kinase